MGVPGAAAENWLGWGKSLLSVGLVCMVGRGGERIGTPLCRSTGRGASSGGGCSCMGGVSGLCPLLQGLPCWELGTDPWAEEALSLINDQGEEKERE